jgi:hypothetical protein
MSEMYFSAILALKVSHILLVAYSRGAKVFQKSRSHLKILGTRMVP